MMRQTVPLALAALSLGGCAFPFVGQGRQSDLPCVGVGMYLPVAPGGDISYGDGDCQSFSKHAQPTYCELNRADKIYVQNPETGKYEWRGDTAAACQ